MLGTLVNGLAIIAGSLLGLFFSKGIPDNYKEIILSAIGLSVILIGFNMLKITTIRVGNLIPAIFLPLVYFAVRQWL